MFQAKHYMNFSAAAEKFAEMHSRGSIATIIIITQIFQKSTQKIFDFFVKACYN